jgi:hypothetical protein
MAVSPINCLYLFTSTLTHFGCENLGVDLLNVAGLILIIDVIACDLGQINFFQLPSLLNEMLSLVYSTANKRSYMELNG